MGNIDSRFGLKPVRYNEDFVEKFFVDADYATALYVGDCVDYDTTDANMDPTAKHGTVIRAAMTAATFTLGPIIAIEPIRTDLYKQYIPASTGGYVYVCTDPRARFWIRGDGGGTPVSTWPGCNAVGIYTHAGSTVTGLSGLELDEGTTTAPAADNTYTFLIHHLADIEDNLLADRAIWEVSLGLHRYASTGDATGILGVL